MKRLFLFLGLMAATSVNASFLYWQVSQTDDYSASYDSARVVVLKESSDGAGDYTPVTDKVFLSYNANVQGETVGGFEWQPTPVTAYVDLGDLTDTSLYAFYIELGNYNSVNNSVSFVADSYAKDLRTYSDLERGGIIVADLSPIALQKAWSAAGSYSVPEPTSGLLMMLGFALVGLRRRKV